MATRTTSQTGVTSDTATWAGAAKPGVGDKIIVSAGHTLTIDENTIVGTSGVAATIDVTVNAGATLYIPYGIKFTHRGSVKLVNGVFKCEGIHEYGSGGSAQLYTVHGGDPTETAAVVWYNGTEAQPFVVQKEAGAGNGSIRRASNSASSFIGLKATWGTFYDIGTSANSYGNRALDINPSGATQELHLDHVTMVRCGALHLPTCPANRNFYINHLRVISPLITSTANLTFSIFPLAATTGQRVFKNVMAAFSYVGLFTSHKLWEWENNIVGRFAEATFTEFSPATYFRNTIIHSRALSVASSFGIPGDTYTNFHFLFDAAAGSESTIAPAINPAGGTVTYDRAYWCSTAADESGDGFGPTTPSASGPWLYHIKRSIPCWNARGLPSGGIWSMHGSYLTQVKIEHCTGGTNFELSPSTNAWFVLNVGADYPQKAGHIQGFDSNFTYAVASEAPGVNGGYGMLFFAGKSFGTAYTRVTATAGTLSTITGGAWATTAGQLLSTGGAVVYVTGKTGAGPPVGETRAITANTAGMITVSPDFSAIPDGGTTFLVLVKDIPVAGSVSNNGFVNCHDGMIYDANGLNGIAKHGYDGFNITDRSQFGLNDINLGQVASLVADGPRFIDPTRSIVKFDREYLLNDPAAWADTTVYAYGDIRKATTSGFFSYGADPYVNYVCIAAHTAVAATNKPGSGSAWRTSWMLASVWRIGEANFYDLRVTDPLLGLVAAPYVEALEAWIREGFRPRHGLLRRAALDGIDMGAVPMRPELPPNIPFHMAA